ncbi:MAG: FAD-dependent oxidoreductase [Chloroflexota bacterium]
MREDARLVIVGAGIVGCSVAYHLAELGWKDIVVVDKGPLYETGGSSSHAPGLIFQTNYSKFMTQCAMYTVDLIKDYVYEGFQSAYQVGGMEVAYTDARMRELWRKHTAATSYGLESHIISAEEAQKMVPIMDPSVIKGAYYVPTDTDVSGWRCAAVMAEKAIAMGAAEFHGHTTVTDFIMEDDRCVGVITDKGNIRTDQVLLATNVWASVLPEKVGVRLPILGVEHQYVITEPLEELAADKDLFINMPIVRHQDFSMYFRQHGDKWGIGNYRHESLMFEGDYVGAKAEREFTPEHFKIAQQATEELFPATKGKEYTRAFNGFMAFSDDMGPIMGETKVPGLLTCLGVWVTHSGGVGKTMAEWMDGRTTEFAIHEGWINRFQAQNYTRKHMYARVDRQYQEVYDIIHPLQQMDNPRGVRLAPYHQRLVEQGGHFHSSAGWEVGHWHEENARFLEKYDEQIPSRSGWEAMNWSRIQGAEHLATRDGVAMYNIAGFAKFEVSGKGAVDFLNYMCANQIDKPIGKVVYTALCDASGGIKADLTITRTAKDTFLILTGAGTGPTDFAWLKMHLPEDGSVNLVDVSSKYTGIGLWGPNAREVLQAVTDSDVSNEAFPYFTSKAFDIGVIPCFAARLSYVGELGWEIYCPQEFGLQLWDEIWEAGKKFEIFALGNGAFGSLRLEKGYRAIGSDIYSDFNPYEAGLGWAVRLKKGDFLGRDALVKIKAEGIKRKLVCLVSDDPNAMALGKEPILKKTKGLNGEANVADKLGYVTSADYGYSVGKLLMYGYVPVEYAEQGTELTVQYFDRKFTAVVSNDPQIDPKMERLKA